MNSLDIFRKLLPFSGSEPSDWIITIAVIVLLMIFIVKVLLSRSEYKNKSRQIEGFENIGDESYFDDQLKNAWDNFQNNLIKDSQGNTYRIYDANQFFTLNTVFKTVGSAKFSYTSSLLLSVGLLGTFIGLFYGLVQLNLDDAEKLQASMSQLIHASGAKFASSIWGLGLSIAFGIYEKRLTNKAQNNLIQLQNTINNLYPSAFSEQSLINLEYIGKVNLSQNKKHFSNNENLLTALNTISTTHNATSQAGFSGLINVLNKNHNESQKGLHGIFNILVKQNEENQKFQEQSLILFKSLKENQENTNKQLKSLTNLTNDLLAVNRDILTNASNISNAVNNLPSGFDGLLKIIEEKCDDLAKNLAEFHQQLSTYLEQINNNNESLLKNNEEQLGYLKEQIEVLNGLAMDIAEELPRLMTNAVSESMDILVKNIGGSEENTLHNAITSGTGADFSEKLENVLQKFVDKIKESTGTDVENINQTIGSISSITQTLNTDVGNLATQMKTLLNAIQSKIDEQANKNSEASNSIQKSAEKAGTVITGALSPISTTLTEFNSLISQAKEYLETIPTHLATFETATVNLKDSAEKTLSASGKLQESSTELKSTSNQLNSTLQDFNNGLNDITNKIKVIPAELQDILKAIQQVSNNAKGTYAELSGQHHQLLNKNKELMTTWITGLEGYQDKTDDFVKQVLGDMEQHIKQVLQEVEKGLNAYKVKSDEHIQSNLAEYDRMIKAFMTQADSLIATTFAKFDGSLGKFATELAGAIEELNGAIEILNQKLQGR